MDYLIKTTLWFFFSKNQKYFRCQIIDTEILIYGHKINCFTIPSFGARGKDSFIVKNEEKKHFIVNIFQKPMQNRTFVSEHMLEHVEGKQKINLWISDFW